MHEPRPLRLVFWETTRQCNLRCLHCRGGRRSGGDLTGPQVDVLLGELAAMGRPIVIFSGGEPLLRPDWPEAARRAGDLGLPTALATNGTLIDAPTAARIAQAGFRRVAVSLDGADAATHDAFRGLPGSFSLALSGCGRVREAGVDLQINCTIAAHNAGRLDALYDLARSLGATALHLFALVPVGCGAAIGPSHQLSPEQYETMLHWVCDRRGGPLQLKATCAPHLFRVLAQRGDTPPAHGRGGALHAETRGCLAGVSVIFVSHRGEVFPCGYLPVPAGRLDADGGGIRRIWRDSPLLAELRDVGRLKGACGRCRYKQTCGGCRARAYAATGDYLAAEPQCAYVPQT
ncbi:MAG: radical SAM protein [Planctomycetes bacterium]|nr:radical SAM protein [Planctomycetota bacterium]